MPTISDEKILYQRLKILSDAFSLSSSSRSLDYKSILRLATKHFKIFTGADASILMLNNTNGILTPVYSIGIPLSKVKDTCLPTSTRLNGILTRPIFDVRYASFMNTPLIHDRKLIGLSAVFSIKPEIFRTFEHDKYEYLLLTMLASYIAVNIENATLINTIKSIEHSKFEWENTFDAIDDLIIIVDTDFSIIRANTSVARKFNMNIRDVIGKKCYKIFHGNEEPWKTCPSRKSLSTMATCTEEIEDPHMGGIFNITSFPRLNKAEKCVGTIQVAKDVTEPKKMWNQIMQTEKMSALGLMIAWIAHEINNPLSVITGFTQSLLNTAEMEYLYELTKILKNADRASTIVKHLLNFIRQTRTIKVPVDIHQVIDESISWFTQRIKVQNVQLIKKYHKLPLIVNCDENELQQVFINLIGNALDAMESQRNGGYILSIETEIEGKSVKVDITDTGNGIPEAILRKIFEPFFTTKEAGKGTGLGLSICHKIIQEHDGSIQVTSQPGKGTTFIIELPQTDIH